MTARCRDCRRQTWIRSIHTHGRRVTRTAPGRRKVLASDVFTACYSGIMATAAILDAGWKDKRRQELDREIEQTKSSIATLMEQSGASDLAQIVSEPSHPGFLPHSTRSITEALKDISSSQYISRDGETLLPKAQWDSRQPLPQGPDGHDTGADDCLLRCGEAVLREEMESWRDWPELHDAQLSQATAYVSALTGALLEQVYKSNQYNRSSPDSAFNAIRMLKSSGYPNFQLPEMEEDSVTEWHTLDYVETRSDLDKARSHAQAVLTGSWPFDETELVETARRSAAEASLRANGLAASMRAHTRKVEAPRLPLKNFETRCRLNDANRRVFAEWNHLNKDKSVAKICYNLLVSPDCPGVNTYNVLLLGFTELGEHELAQVVADYSLNRNYRQRSSATILCLLNHYRLKGDFLQFQSLLRRLIGCDPYDTLLRPIPIALARKHKHLQKWAEKYDVSIADHALLERPKLGHNSLNAILQGLLDFGDIRGAASFFTSCLGEGYRIQAQIKDRLFDMCITTTDIDPARILVDGFLRYFENTVNVMGRSGKHGLWAISGAEIRRLLNIARGRPFQIGNSVTERMKGFANVPLTRAQKSLIPDRIRYLGFFAWSEGILQHLKRVRKILLNISAVLTVAQPNTELLLELSDRMDQEHRLLEQQRWANEHAQATARVTWFDDQVRRSHRWLMKVDNHIHYAYPSTAMLVKELRKPGITASRVVDCIEHYMDHADRKHTDILWQLLETLTPREKWEDAKENALLLSEVELFMAVSERFAGRMNRASGGELPVLDNFTFLPWLGTTVIS